MHQKDGVNDDDFEPYLSGQTNQVTSNNEPYCSQYIAQNILPMFSRCGQITRSHETGIQICFTVLTSFYFVH